MQHIWAVRTICLVFALSISALYSAHAQVSCPSFTDPGCVSPEYTESLIGTESGGSYTIAAPNSSALGRYQFLDGTRALICGKYPVPCVDRTTFANCPQLQDAYFSYLVQDQIQENTTRGTFDYVGQTINGITVTESGIIAATHLRGGSAVEQWLESGGAIDLGDPNGTQVSDYMRTHGGHPISTGGTDCPIPPPPGTPTVAPPPPTGSPPPTASCSGSGSPMCTASGVGTELDVGEDFLMPDVPDVSEFLRCADRCNNAPSSTSQQLYYRECSTPPGSDYSMYSGCCCPGDIIFGGINPGRECPCCFFSCDD